MPPQKNQDFVANSPLAGRGGWTAADKDTMQSPLYPNVFSVGDSAGVPSSKTAASTFSQIPVMVENLVRHAQGKEGSATSVSYTHLTLPTICSV